MKVAVHGLGKLGYPLARLIAWAGHDVIGVDSDVTLVNRIRLGTYRSREPYVETLTPGGGSPNGEGSFVALNLAGFQEHADLIDLHIVIVPTPSLTDGQFSSRFVRDAVENIVRHRDAHPYEPDPVIVVSSTVMPGTCRGIEAVTGLPVVYSPEFIALGDVIANMTNPDLILVGHHDNAAAERYLTVARSLLAEPQWVPVVAVGLREAEIAKLAVNAYVTMKISFANGLSHAAMAHSADDDPVDAVRVAHAVGHDRRIGHAYLTPGAPFGGPCFERDHRAFAHVARTTTSVWTSSLHDYVAGANEDALRLVLHQVDRALRDWRMPAADGPVEVRKPRLGIVGLGYREGSMTITDGSLAVKVIGQAPHIPAETFMWDPDLTERDVESLHLSAKWSADALRADVILLAMPFDGWEDVVPEPSPEHLIVDPWRCFPGREHTYTIGAPHG